MCHGRGAALRLDTSGRLVKTWDPRISPTLVTSYTYDSNGRLRTLTPAGFATTTFGYDSLGRIITVAHPDPSGPRRPAPWSTGTSCLRRERTNKPHAKRRSRCRVKGP